MFKVRALEVLVPEHELFPHLAPSLRLVFVARCQQECCDVSQSLSDVRACVGVPAVSQPAAGSGRCLCPRRRLAQPPRTSACSSGSIF